MKFFLTLILLLFISSCKDNEKAAKERDKLLPTIDWVKKPKNEWPQILLTNEAEFTGHTPMVGASSFLFENNKGKVLGGTVKHLIGPNGGVEPTIEVDKFNSVLIYWHMHPRTNRDAYVNVKGIAVDGLDSMFYDWLIFELEQQEKLPALPLKIRESPVEIGEKVYLIGVPYSEPESSQNVYEGKVTHRSGDYFRYSIKPSANISGFSGAPIIDSKGYLVGTMTVWFNAKMKGRHYLEAGGEDIATFYKEVNELK